MSVCPGARDFIAARLIRRVVGHTAAAGLIAGIVVLVDRQAAAQTLDRILPPDIAGIATEPDVTVLSRKQPDYDAPGVRVGVLTLRPTLTQTAGYETNVLGTRNPRGSPIIETLASLSAETNQSRFNGSASVNVDNVRYTDETSQSHTNWGATVGGGYSLGRDTLAVYYSHQNLSQTLQDLGVSQLLTQALPYREDDVRISYRSELPRVFLVPALEVTNYSYDNGKIGDFVYQQDYRNRLVVQPSLTAGYELSPRRNLIVVVRDSIANYTVNTAGTSTRDYNDVTVLAGIDYDINGIVRVRGLGGYQIRNFKSQQLQSIQAPIIEASASWNVTKLTTVTGSASRAIQDSSDVNTAGITETSLRLRADQEYARNIVLSARGGFTIDEYPGSGSQRLYTAGVGANYLLNRNMSVGGTYDFIRRSSDGLSNTNIAGTGQTLGGSFSDNRFVLQLRLRL